MDRRSFIRDTGGAVLWATGWKAADVAPQPCPEHGASIPAPGFAAVSVAVFDPSLVQGRGLALDAARRAIPAFALEPDADIGALWHARIAPCIARHTVLAAVLRPADAFVLERFAAMLDVRLIDAWSDTRAVAKTGNRDSSDRT